MVPVYARIWFLLVVVVEDKGRAGRWVLISGRTEGKKICGVVTYGEFNGDVKSTIVGRSLGVADSTSVISELE